MAQKKDIPIFQIIIVLAVIVAGIYLVKTYILKPKEEEEKNDSSTTSKGGSSSSNSGSSSTAPAPKPPVSSSGLPILGNDKVLKRGDKAAEVKYIQYEYNRQHAAPLFKVKLAEDGIFGANTEKAVMEIMKKKETSFKEFMTKLKTLYPVPTWQDYVPTFSWLD